MPAAPTTRWSLVLRAARGHGDAREALQSLLSAYRPVVLAHFRRTGDAATAEDATQAFLLHFVDHDLAARADRDRGSFRAFLFAAMQNHRRQAWRDSHAARRDAGEATDIQALDSLADPQPAPSAAFDRDWALRVIARAHDRLREEATASRKGHLFDALQPFLAESPDAGDYGRVGAELGLDANTLAVAVKRLRERLRANVRRELAETLPDGADVDAEIAWLRQALRPD